LEHHVVGVYSDWRSMLVMHGSAVIFYFIKRQKERMMSEDKDPQLTRDPHKAVDHILRYASMFARAKSERVQIEHYRKSLKALLMKRSGETAIGAQEREAYAHSEMIALLDGLKAAVEIEEKLKWEITAAELRVEIWRTEQANNRAEGRATQ
jgi:hypothetical protein